jgi:translation machinery-associated protein 16
MLQIADRYAFFLHAMPPEKSHLTLPEVHEVVQDLWLTRNDLLLKQEQASRRKGRPKSAKEDQLAESKRQDAEEYRTGFELPDLTDENNVKLFRQWDGVDASYLRILRIFRISGEFPDTLHVSRAGRDKVSDAKVAKEDAIGEDEDEEMEDLGSEKDAE